jgi:hypothetical protein
MPAQTAQATMDALSTWIIVMTAAIVFYRVVTRSRRKRVMLQRWAALPWPNPPATLEATEGCTEFCFDAEGSSKKPIRSSHINVDVFAGFFKTCLHTAKDQFLDQSPPVPMRVPALT